MRLHHEQKNVMKNIQQRDTFFPANLIRKRVQANERKV